MFGLGLGLAGDFDSAQRCTCKSAFVFRYLDMQALKGLLCRNYLQLWVELRTL